MAPATLGQACDQLTLERSYYDVWANSAYGYSGSAGGISDKVLMETQRHIGKLNVGDDHSVQIGINAYKAHPNGITSDELKAMVLANLSNADWLEKVSSR